MGRLRVVDEGTRGGSGAANHPEAIRSFGPVHRGADGLAAADRRDDPEPDRRLVLGPSSRARAGVASPFLLFPTPVAALAIFGLAFCAPIGAFANKLLGSHSPGDATSVLMTIALFWATFEIATMICNAVFGALVNDVVPQPVLGLFGGAFRALSLIAGVVFNHWLLGKAADHYTWIFIGIATLYGVGFSLMCWKVKEGSYPPPEPRGAPSVTATLSAVKGLLPRLLWAFVLLVALLVRRDLRRRVHAIQSLQLLLRATAQHGPFRLRRLHGGDVCDLDGGGDTARFTG